MQPNKRVKKERQDAFYLSNRYTDLLPRFLRFICICASVLLLGNAAFSQNNYENRKIEKVEIILEGNDRNVSAAEQFRLIAQDALGPKYAAVKVRDSLQALYDTKKISSISVEAAEDGPAGVDLRFNVKRK